MWYNISMHKTFYASGFLYHAPTQQILLQITNSSEVPTVTLFCGKAEKDETQTQVLKRILKEILHITVSESAIHPIYDYEHETEKIPQYLLYIEINDEVYEKLIKKEDSIRLVPLKQLTKQKLPEQIKQDIIVGQRVILLAEREKLTQTEEV